jgi:uncharacterized OsmC-like protein
MHTETIHALRLGRYGTLIVKDGAELEVATRSEETDNAFGPVALQLAAVAACMMRTIEDVAPSHGVRFDGLDVALGADWQEAPPGLVRIGYVITVRTDADADRLDDLHEAVRSAGAVCCTLRRAVPLEGVLRRADPADVVADEA